MKWNEKNSTEKDIDSTNQKYDTVKDSSTHNNEEKNNMTTISKDANIIGNISGKEDIHMSGSMKGDIDCSKNLFIDGNILGNLSANTLQLEKATIEGSITCNADANIDESSHVKGDIYAENLIVGGTIEGNLIIKGDLHILKTANIKGNVEANSLESEKGAVLKGQCTIAG